MSVRSTHFSGHTGDHPGRDLAPGDRYILALQDRQAVRRRREEEGGLLPMSWGWNERRCGLERTASRYEYYSNEYPDDYVTAGVDNNWVKGR